MHTIKNCYIDTYLIYNAIRDCFVGKMNRDEVYVELSKCSYMIYTPNQIRELYLTGGIDAIAPFIITMAKKYYIEIMTRDVHFAPIEYQTRYEPASQKTRIISIQSIKQLIFDYIVVIALGKLFENHFGAYQSASIPGRGQSHTKEAIEDWVRNDPKGTRYYIKTDVVNYFHSIDHELLYEMINKYVKDETVLYLIRVTFNTYDEIGLSIGSYMSQYLANFFMSDVYHIFSEKQLKTRRDTTHNMVKHIVIYMDDILIFFQNKSDMEKVYTALTKCIKDKKLELHNTIMKEFKPNDFIDIIGYRFYRDHTTIRKRTYKRMFKLAKRTEKHGMTVNKAYKFIAYNGIILSSDYNKLCRRYAFPSAIYHAKQKISRHDRLSS